MPSRSFCQQNSASIILLQGLLWIYLPSTLPVKAPKKATLWDWSQDLLSPYLPGIGALHVWTDTHRKRATDAAHRLGT